MDIFKQSMQNAIDSVQDVDARVSREKPYLIATAQKIIDRINSGETISDNEQTSTMMTLRRLYGNISQETKIAAINRR